MQRAHSDSGVRHFTRASHSDSIYKKPQTSTQAKFSHGLTAPSDKAATEIFQAAVKARAAAMAVRDETTGRPLASGRKA